MRGRFPQPTGPWRGLASTLPVACQASNLSPVFCTNRSLPNTTLLIEMAHWGFAGNLSRCLAQALAFSLHRLFLVHLFKYSSAAAPNMRAKSPTGSHRLVSHLLHRVVHSSALRFLGTAKISESLPLIFMLSTWIRWCNGEHKRLLSIGGWPA